MSYILFLFSTAFIIASTCSGSILVLIDKVPHKSHTKNERSRLGQALFYCVQVINLIARGFLVTEGAALKFSHQPFSGLGGDSPRKGEGRGQ